MTVGEWAIAVGRTYDQPLPNVSVGVLSATGRIWSTAIQTDAKISPANYGGPLIDIQGRVLGILVPLSPQRGSGEVAGAEWYDSGIGFAVPLADVLKHLPTLKAGKDLHPGVMGITLKQGDRYALPAELAATHPLSPAYKAALKAGDTIVEIDGTPITRQSQLQHALGPRYAGEKVHLVFTRGKEKERHEIDIELIDKLIPYEHPFLGILPLREGENVRVRFAYPGSPAAAAGIKPGDSVIEFAAEKSEPENITDAAQLRAAIANLEPKAKARLKIQRDGETLSLELAPAKLPTDIPGDLPLPVKEPLPPAAEKTVTGIVEIKLPEEKNECVAFVPENYHPQMPHGLVVVLSAPGAVDRDKLASRWKAVWTRPGSPPTAIRRAERWPISSALITPTAFAPSSRSTRSRPTAPGFQNPTQLTGWPSSSPQQKNRRPLRSSNRFSLLWRGLSFRSQKSRSAKNLAI
ncbi:MAG: PDZ domain-containing protein [Planctomycetia bacterium]|nr:PDZ domain-containing protein [Planctomycetia bacterium]